MRVGNTCGQMVPSSGRAQVLQHLLLRVLELLACVHHMTEGDVIRHAHRTIYKPVVGYAARKVHLTWKQLHNLTNSIFNPTNSISNPTNSISHPTNSISNPTNSVRTPTSTHLVSVCTCSTKPNSGGHVLGYYVTNQGRPHAGVLCNQPGAATCWGAV